VKEETKALIGNDKLQDSNPDILLKDESRVNRVKTIMIGRNLEQINYLENLVQKQFIKHKEIYKYI